MTGRLIFAAALSLGFATGADAGYNAYKVSPDGTYVVGGSNRTGCK